MAIPTVQLPDLSLENLSESDKAKLNEFLSEVVETLNDLVSVVNANHP